MRKRSLVCFIGMLGIVLLTGCGTKAEGENQKEPATPTAIPTETVKEAEPSGEKKPSGEKEPSGEEEPSYEISFTGKEETEEGKDGDFVYFKSTVNYSVFEGTYGDNLNRFVESLIEEFRKEVPAAKENAELDYADFRDGGMSELIFPEVEELTVNFQFVKEKTCVLFANWFSDTGGVHPNTVNKSYVVDITTGKEILFESVLTPYGVTKEAVVTYAIEKIKEEHADELYPFNDDEYLVQQVNRFTVDNQWYLNDTGVVLFANPYDIAPYAYGMIECTIPYDVLEGLLKK